MNKLPEFNCTNTNISVDSVTLLSGLTRRCCSRVCRWGRRSKRADHAPFASTNEKRENHDVIVICVEAITCSLPSAASAC